MIMGVKIEAAEELVPWYLLRAATRQERRACESLKESRLRVETYLPLETVDRILGGKADFVERPWLPGYFFAQIHDVDFHAAIEVFGVYGPVMTYNSAGERAPKVIAPALVAGIRALQAAGAFDRRRIVKPLETGDTVRILAGPFEGLIGALLEVRGKDRVTLLINGRTVGADLSQIEAAA